MSADIRKIPRSLNSDSMFCLGTANKNKPATFCKKILTVGWTKDRFCVCLSFIWSWSLNHCEFMRLCHVYLGNIQFTGILLPHIKSVNILRMRNYWHRVSNLRAQWRHGRVRSHCRSRCRAMTMGISSVKPELGAMLDLFWWRHH